uniref:Uncharacterized protein n=1 Tax=Triticum urartu TaxID=4572 RepID=A0A8R7PN09_TRIUA
MVLWVLNDGNSSSMSPSIIPWPGMGGDDSLAPNPPPSSVFSGALGSPGLHVLSWSGLHTKPPVAFACLVASSAHASTTASISDTRADGAMAMLVLLCTAGGVWRRHRC